jgi:hypothetical protein
MYKPIFSSAIPLVRSSIVILAIAFVVAFFTVPNFDERFLDPLSDDDKKAFESAVMGAEDKIRLEHIPLDPFYVNCRVLSADIDTLAIRRAHQYLCGQAGKQLKRPCWQGLNVIDRNGKFLFVHWYPDIISPYYDPR